MENKALKYFEGTRPQDMFRYQKNSFADDLKHTGINYQSYSTTTKFV